MNGNYEPAIEALALGMSTVFLGLLLLLLSMKIMSVGLAWRRKRLTARAQRLREEDARSEEANRVQAAADVDAMSGELLIAIASALHLDDIAIEEMEAQSLTWTRMFKPFSPWVMDSKTTLHTHRLRWRPAGATGRVVRGQG
jgi:Na+-transporting methylmalonyl-CoA/oxaloacetate decarboxylase gamma subunit